MRILVIDEGKWGDALISDIETLLLDIASHINGELREQDRFMEIIKVIHAPGNPGDLCYVPMVHFRNSSDKYFTIQLTAKDQLWGQYTYQFAHEFCHVLSRYNDLRDNPNNWFHEAICELASVFTLRRMAEQWQTNPPFSNWKEYSVSLSIYENDTRNKFEDKLQEKYKTKLRDKYGIEKLQLLSNSSDGINLPGWLSSMEGELRGNIVKKIYDRPEYALVAYTLLPIFEKDPRGWNAVRKFPVTESPIREYLDEWQQQVDSDDKSFVGHCIKGIEKIL